MLPVINDNCGESPANLLLRFIGLEFSSFESLYRQLGFDSPLPISCRSLIKHAMATDQQQIQKPFSRASAKFYKLYPNNNSLVARPSWLFVNLSMLLPWLLLASPFLAIICLL
jgi:hypothetical protein